MAPPVYGKVINRDLPFNNEIPWLQLSVYVIPSDADTTGIDELCQSRFATESRFAPRYTVCTSQRLSALNVFSARDLRAL